MIFDLDGTLVQTERLKALSFACTAVELSPHGITEKNVIETFKDVVGLSRWEVATMLLQRFNLQKVAEKRMVEFGVRVPWQAFVQMRLRYYEAMLADPAVLRDNQWPHNIALLEEARRAHYRIGLATMSYCAQVGRVLDILDLAEAFDFVAGRQEA